MHAAVLDRSFAPEETSDDATSGKSLAKPAKKFRVQLDLPERSMDRLSELKNMTDAASNAEVIRHAIRLYENMVKEVASGKEFFVKESNGSILPYRMFL